MNNSISNIKINNCCNNSSIINCIGISGSEVLFWKVWRNKYLRIKIFKTFKSYLFEGRYNYYEIISIEWMVKNKHYSLLKEKIKNKENLSFYYIYIDDSERFNESGLFSSSSSSSSSSSTSSSTSFKITKNMDLTTLKVFKYSIFNCPEFKYGSKEEYKELYLKLFENYSHYLFSFTNNNSYSLNNQNNNSNNQIKFNDLINLINISTSNHNEMVNLALKMIEYDNSIVLEIFIEKFKFKPKVENLLRALSIGSLKVAEFLFNRFDFKIKNKEKLWRELCETYPNNHHHHHHHKDILTNNSTTTTTATSSSTNISFSSSTTSDVRLISSNQINQRVLFLTNVMKFEPPSEIKDFKYFFNLYLYDQPLRVLYESCITISLLKQPLQPFLDYIRDSSKRSSSSLLSNKFIHNLKNIEIYQKLEHLKLSINILSLQELKDMNFEPNELDQLIKNFQSSIISNNSSSGGIGNDKSVNEKVERLLKMILHFLDPHPVTFNKNITFIISRYYNDNNYFQVLKDWIEKETFYKYCSKEKELQLTNYLVSNYNERDLPSLKYLLNLLIVQDKIDSIKIVFDKIYKIQKIRYENQIITGNRINNNQLNSSGVGNSLNNNNNIVNKNEKEKEREISATVFNYNSFIMVNSIKVFDFIYDKISNQFHLNQIFPHKCFLIEHYYENYYSDYKSQMRKFCFESRTIPQDSLRFIYLHLDDFRVSLSYLINNWWNLSKQFEINSSNNNINSGIGEENNNSILNESYQDDEMLFQRFKFFVTSATYMKGPEIALYHYYNNTFQQYLLEKIENLNDKDYSQEKLLHHSPFDSTNYSLTNCLNQIITQIGSRGDIQTLEFLMKTLFKNENDNLVERKFIIGILFSAISVGQLRIFQFLMENNYKWVFNLYEDSITFSHFNQKNHNNQNHNNNSHQNLNNNEKKLEIFKKFNYRITSDTLKRMIVVAYDHCHIDILNYLQTIPSFKDYINFNLIKRFL